MLLLLFITLITWSTVSVRGEYTYNETEARILSNLAAGAYSTTPSACINRTLPDDWLLYSKIDTICDEISSTCAAYVLRSDKQKRIILVFRGTKSKEQLLFEGWKSLNEGRDFYGAGRANRYFFHALRVLWPRIEPLLRDPVFKDYSVTVTGHSLGGALASLTALKIALDGLRPSDKLKMVTFGQPRVGDYDLARKHDELVPNSFRVVHRKDIVPHMPACDKNNSFVVDNSEACSVEPDNVAYHHTTEVWYPDGMEPGDKYIVCRGPPPGEDMNCSDKLLFDWNNKDEYIHDHRYYFGHKACFSHGFFFATISEADSSTCSTTKLVWFGLTALLGCLLFPPQKGEI
ncbi:hypothetical protein AB6A40_010140 [Gnathostoma spinigerum]|uniref:Fungal lipase-type domain-containing protein n=1 Tax=Gnathostoma spinigerum TaxID=75299 RepID=A0ABD6EVQ2_9BILA